MVEIPKAVVDNPPYTIPVLVFLWTMYGVAVIMVMVVFLMH